MRAEYDHPQASWIGKPILQDAVLDRVAARLRVKALPLALKLWNQKTVAGTTPAKVLGAPGASCPGQTELWELGQGVRPPDSPGGAARRCLASLYFFS